MLIPVMPVIMTIGCYAYRKLTDTFISGTIFYMMTVYGIIMSIILTAAPVLLYNDRFNGNNQVFEKISWYLGVDITGYFPSFVSRSNTPDFSSFKLTFIYLAVIIILYSLYSFEVKKYAGRNIDCRSHL